MPENRASAVFVSSHGRYTLELVQSFEELRSGGHHELDPSWKTTDPAGHEHSNLDTLHWVVTGVVYCPDCRDDHDEGEYRCRVCEAPVEPKYRWTGPYTFTVPGLRGGRLAMEDGRTWILLGGENNIPFVDGSPSEDWVAAVIARDPDEVTITIGGTR